MKKTIKTEALIKLVFWCPKCKVVQITTEEKRAINAILERRWACRACGSNIQVTIGDKPNGR